MPSTVPHRSTPQRLAALESANRIRVARARLKATLKADYPLGKLIALVGDPGGARELMPPEDAAAAPAAFAAGMPLVAALDAAAGIGPVKRNRMLRHADASPAKTLGGMTARQRASVIAELLIVRRRRGYGRDPLETTIERTHR